MPPRALAAIKSSSRPDVVAQPRPHSLRDAMLLPRSLLSILVEQVGVGGLM
jgi:hypothetical protein